MRVIPKSYGIATMLVAGAAALSGIGCEKPKEDVLDIKAPGFQLDVDKTSDGAHVKFGAGDEEKGMSVDVEAKKGEGASVDVQPQTSPEA